jgi:phage shock protein PspC (stress-responsive transcriptional regulator)
MKKLYRSRFGKIAGICKGISEYFNIDEIIIRLIFLVLIFTPFPIIILYVISWMVIPKNKLY